MHTEVKTTCPHWPKWGGSGFHVRLGVLGSKPPDIGCTQRSRQHALTGRAGVVRDYTLGWGYWGHWVLNQLLTAGWVFTTKRLWCNY